MLLFVQGVLILLRKVIAEIIFTLLKSDSTFVELFMEGENFSNILFLVSIKRPYPAQIRALHTSLIII